MISLQDGDMGIESVLMGFWILRIAKQDLLIRNCNSEFAENQFASRVWGLSTFI